MTTLTIDLPDKLLKEAEQAGLLTSNAIEMILRDRLRSRAIDDLFTTADKLIAANFPTMSMEEIQKEVNIVRKQKNQRASGS